MRRRVLTMLVAVLVAAGCVVAGVWQWHRHWDRTAQADLVDTNYDAEAVPLDQLLAPSFDRRDTWRPAAVTGRYVDALVLRGRPVSGGPAVHDLGVVEVVDGALRGSLLVVDRGWLRLTPDEGLPAAPARPTGPVQLVVRLRPLEASSDRTGARGEVYRIAPADLARAGVTGALPAYGVVVTEDGAPPAGLSAVPRPEFSLGVNLSYAFQWWVFALGSLVGGVMLLRQRAPGDDVDGPESRPDEPGATPTPTTDTAPTDQGRRRARRRPTAEEEEDAIVDAQERAAHPPTTR